MSSTNKAIEILLVEDNEGDIVLTRKALEQGELPHQLNVCRNGEEAINYLFKRQGHEDAVTPDLILLDLNLPRVSGSEVLQTIKKDPKLGSIPVIVLTTSDAQEDVVRSYQLHASSFIRKPVDFPEFDMVLRQLQDYWFSIVKLPR